ncbi:MAG TPA: hypothetical protein QF353_03615 [Gammaproteobacteria bacterium]|nr:hypothetical protein [Gammaproteobacteria bacterium]
MNLKNSKTVLILPKFLTLADIDRVDKKFIFLLKKGPLVVDARGLETTSLATFSMLKVWKERARRQNKCLNVLYLPEVMIDLPSNA